MDIPDEEFNDEFQTFGFDVSNPDIIDKLKQLCHLYRQDASEIAMQWVAFSHSHKNCPLTGEYLDQMERERLSKKGSKPLKTPNRKKEPKVYDISSLEEAIETSDADDILDAYSTPGSKGSKKRQHTPDHSQAKRFPGVSHSPAVPFSPASLSPASATPSRKYSSRSNAGDVVFNMGPSSNAQWRTSRETPCTITPYDSTQSVTDKFKYMFQKLTDKALVLNDMIEEMSSHLQQHHGIEEVAHLALPAQEETTVIGRICCDSNGKLNAKSVVLEGSRETSAGKRIAVELSGVKQYSLFPGQIVAMDGINTTGTTFVASKVYDGVTLPLPKNRPDYKEGALTVVVAAGPFTTSDSLMYEPLADLIKYLQKTPPDVCILLGPFMDIKHPEIEKGNLSETFEDFFSNTMIKLSAAIEKLPTKLVVVPSQRDVHHEPIYPQPSFVLNKEDTKKCHKIHFCPDPSTLVIDGVVFGMTSADILFHLGAEEISVPLGGSDRLARLAQHILTQHSFYPLYPSPEDVSVDTEQLDTYGRLPVTPHVLIIPSDLRYFVKDVCGCCCVNPGKLSKGQVGGTFTRLSIKPPSGDNSSPSLVSNIAAEVVRI